MLRARDGRPPGRARPPPPEHHRPDAARRPADGVRGRPLLDHLQRRALQLPRAAGRARARRRRASQPTATPRCCSRMYARDGEAMLAPAERHLRLRDLGRRARRAVPRARPARRQAALLRAARRDARTSPPRSRRSCRRSRRPALRPTALADYLTFLWVPDPDTMFEGDLQAARRATARVPRRTAARSQQYWDLDVRARGAARGGVGRRRPRRRRRTPSAARWSPTCRSAASSAAASTRARSSPR